MLTQKETLETLALNILATSKRESLPNAYHRDIASDIETLNRFQNDTIWILRDAGTVIAPLYMGIEPVYVTYWLNGKDSKAKTFLIKKTGHIEKISFEQAEKLIHAAPAEITSFQTTTQIYNTVNTVLQDGIDNGIWGIFDKPSSIPSVGDIYDWLEYFSHHKNAVMVDFMSKAIRILASLKS